MQYQRKMRDDSRRAKILAEIGIGVSRFTDLQRLGADARLLRQMVEAGDLEKVCHGTYRLKASPDTTWQSFAVIGKRYPEAVICMVSAAAFHGLTTANPPEVWAAFPYEASVPRVSDAAVRGLRWREAGMSVGIDVRTIAGVPVRVTSPARTVIDLIWSMNRSGETELAMECLRAYADKGLPLADLSRCAKSLRRFDSVRPYVEAVQGFRSM